MNISGKKIAVLAGFKTKELFKNKTFIISVLLVPIMTLAMRYAYSSLSEGTLPPSLMSLVLSFGLLFNICAVALMMPATLLAKDKEKNTLRTLMTSSVNGADYFIASLIPILISSIIINMLVLFISGMSLTVSNNILYVLVSTLSVIISAILGMIIGVFAKNQMAASNMLTIVMLLLMLLPMFSNMIDSLKSVSQFLYTGVVSTVVSEFANGTAYQLPTLSWIILIGEAILAIVVFTLVYKRNGFDCD